MSGFQNSYRLLATMLSACVLLGGCNTLPPGGEVAEPEPHRDTTPPAGGQTRQSETESLIGYYAQLRKLSGAELAREHDAARQAYGRVRSDYAGMRLAMLVALPNTPFYDEVRALDLLDPIARNGDARLSGLAWLLSTQIQERRRVDANAQALQQKLDALKSLERSLIERKR